MICKIGDCLEEQKTSCMPLPGKIYSLYSFAAFDDKKIPEIVDGDAIKSNKFIVSGNMILFNKLNVQNKRVWNIHDLNESNSICSTEFIPLVCKDGISQDFIYYILTSKKLTKTMFAARKGTSNSQQRIDTEILFNYEFELPDYPTQCKIASILSSLDSKISINNKIIADIEKQTRALYEETFINNEKLEKHIVSLSDLMDYAGGSQPPASKFIFEKKDGYVRFVQIRDYDNDDHVTYIPISKKNKLCDDHDIMIARYGASLGRICCGLNGAYNVALAKVFPKKEYYLEFLRLYLSSRDFYEGINNKGDRSAQAGFNQGDIDSFEIDFPVNESIVKDFNDIASMFYEKKLKNIYENRMLSELRDTLLPKLISGEIDIKSANI